MVERQGELFGRSLRLPSRSPSPYVLSALLSFPSNRNESDPVAARWMQILFSFLFFFVLGLNSSFGRFSPWGLDRARYYGRGFFGGFRICLGVLWPISNLCLSMWLAIENSSEIRQIHPVDSSFFSPSRTFDHSPLRFKNKFNKKLIQGIYFSMDVIHERYSSCKPCYTWTLCHDRE